VIVGDDHEARLHVGAPEIELGETLVIDIEGRLALRARHRRDFRDQFAAEWKSRLAVGAGERMDDRETHGQSSR
jgi:hypothetical protein